MALRAKIKTDKRKGGRPIKWTEDIILEHGRRIIKWAYDNPAMWRIGRYFTENRIPPRLHEEWSRISEIYKDQAAIARSVLLENLHWLLGTDQMEKYYAYRMLRIMDKEHNEAVKILNFEDEKIKEKAKIEAEKEVGGDNTLKVVFENRPTGTDLSSEYITIP